MHMTHPIPVGRADVPAQAADPDGEDPSLQALREVAEALRHAYQFNKQAERYHLRGAKAAALHQLSLAGRQVQRAQAQLRSLALAQSFDPAMTAGLSRQGVVSPA